MQQQHGEYRPQLSRPTADSSQRYHGGDIYSAELDLGLDRSVLLDFSANIMPAKIDDTLKDAINAAIDDCRYYPDPQQRRLRQALARHHGLKPEQIVCGNGAADLIFRTVHALKPVRSYLPVPSFSEYERALREGGCEIKYWQIEESTGFRIDTNMLDWLREMESEAQDNSVRLLILCQPNNPTGILIEPEIMAQIVNFCSDQGICLFLDECFLDFLGPARGAAYSCMSRLGSKDKDLRLILLRSMTKYYSMPGLRAGYICSSTELASCIMASGQPWSVGTLTEAAVLAILRRDAACQQTLTDQVELWLSSERPALEKALIDRGFEVWPGAANFVFFRASNCPDIAEQLKQKGIIIRSCADYSGLDQSFYRIAVLDPEANKQFIHALFNISVLSY